MRRANYQSDSLWVWLSGIIRWQWLLVTNCEKRGKWMERAPAMKCVNDLTCLLLLSGKTYQKTIDQCVQPLKVNYLWIKFTMQFVVQFLICCDYYNCESHACHKSIFSLKFMLWLPFLFEKISRQVRYFFLGKKINYFPLYFEKDVFI